MTVQEIVTRVRSAIDELMENDSQFLRQSTDEANLTRVIVDKIGYALQYVYENAPLNKLDSSAFEELTQQEVQSSFSIGSDLVGRLKLPSGLMRIVTARLSSWSHFPIPEPDTSQVYLMQQDQYAKGSWDRPVNILTAGTLEMYCAKNQSDTLKFVFIRKPSTSFSPDAPTTQVKIPALLEASLIYQVAGLSMVAFREDVAASLFAIADKYLDINVKGGEN